MKVLFDECVDRLLARELPDHDIKTTRQMGWLSVQNGALLALAAKEFDVFVTLDNQMQYQQNLKALPLPMIVLRTMSRRPSDVWALVPKLRKLLEKTPVERVTVISPDAF